MQNWKPIVARDRQEVSAEIINRHNAGLSSRQKAISDFGDIENIEEELARIEEDAAKKIEQMQSMSPKDTEPKDDKPEMDKNLTKDKK
ncbi:MAG: hypothetical protein HC892_00275 [Saprospiraceae bacterium]|nr:hypothetical protein [Saprospiraceae bacterium]